MKLVINIGSMTNMLYNTSLSSTNYDSILNGLVNVSVQNKNVRYWCVL